MAVTKVPPTKIDHFFAASSARLDRWRDLNESAQKWCSRGGSARNGEPRDTCSETLAQLGAIEQFQAFPGPRLMNDLKERLSEDDQAGFARLVRRIASALLSRSYRSEAAEWDSDEEPTGGGRTMPTAARDPKARPYFETLFVTPSPAARWPAQIEQVRRLRRPQDEFVYEPVMVGSFEDALLAVILNPNLESVVIAEGFTYASAHDLPVFRSLLEGRLPFDPADPPIGDLGLPLATAIKRIRPELDLFLLADR
jgi:arginine decarboxylase